MLRKALKQALGVALGITLGGTLLLELLGIRRYTNAPPLYLRALLSFAVAYCAAILIALGVAWLKEKLKK